MNRRPRILLLTLLPLLLTACGIDEPHVPGIAHLTAHSISMQGTFETTVDVDATGSWAIYPSRSWLTAHPSSGTGSTAVKLLVHHDALTPGRYSADLTLVSAGWKETIRVDFSFPRLRGIIARGSGSADAGDASFAQTLSTGPGNLVVGLWEAAVIEHGGPLRDVAEELAVEHDAGLVEVYENLDAFAVDVADLAAARSRFAADPRVKYAQPETGYAPLLSRTPNDPLFDGQWSLETMNVPRAWRHSTGAGVRLAVVDVGFYEHEDLLATRVDPARYTGRAEVTACGNHGNHVAGIAGAVTGNGRGIAGIAADAELLLLEVGRLFAGTDCQISSLALLDALDWLLGDEAGGPRADIVNLSLGGPSHDRAVADSIRRLYRAGVLVVAAAGNFYPQPVFFPASMPEVVAVGATNSDDEVASYSARGPELFVTAPGGDASAGILSLYDDPRLRPDGGYARMTGTSMASPAVAAIAALVKAVNSDLTPAGLAGILADSSVDLGPEGFDELHGYGRVDALAAVRLAREWGVEDAAGFRMRAPGVDSLAPVRESFELPFVPFGEFTLEAGSDENWNGILDEPGEWYGSAVVNVRPGAPVTEVTIPVARLR